MRKSLSLLLPVALVAGITAYAALGYSSNGDKRKDEASIRAVLDSTSAGWNQGNLQQYLSAYTDEATELGPNGPRGGRSVIEQTMRNGFWKTGRPVQNLRYEHVEVRMLGKDNALVTGQFVLSGGERPDRTGWFTTVWTRTKEGWRMIHDHS
ncbi:MAG TPA: nuclear transport factor 2 family protein [Pyrinomonadaceae bacterium]